MPFSIIELVRERGGSLFYADDAPDPEEGANLAYKVYFRFNISAGSVVVGRITLENSISSSSAFAGSPFYYFFLYLEIISFSISSAFCFYSEVICEYFISVEY